MNLLLLGPVQPLTLCAVLGALDPVPAPYKHVPRNTISSEGTGQLTGCCRPVDC